MDKEVFQEHITANFPWRNNFFLLILSDILKVFWKIILSSKDSQALFVLCITLSHNL